MQTKNIKKYLQEIYDDRLGVSDLKPILKQVCRDYRIGNLLNFALNEYGFQDVNVEITTSIGKYFVKFFSRDKTQTQIASYVKLMEIVGKSKVSYPALYKGTNGYLHSIIFNRIPINSLSLARIYLRQSKFRLTIWKA